MNLKPVAKIEGGQDGAVWKDYLLRFDHEGHCCVYHMKEIEESEGGVVSPWLRSALDMAQRLKPHCNSVMFGNEYYIALRMNFPCYIPTFITAMRAEKTL